jgi:hypothetical protein
MKINITYEGNDSRYLVKNLIKVMDKIDSMDYFKADSVTFDNEEVVKNIVELVNE